MSDILRTYDDPIAPVLNLNGNTYASLIDEIHGVRETLRFSIDRMLSMDYTHPRNYPGGESCENARNEHISRVDRLRSVYDELRIIMDKLYEQQKGRL